MIFTLIYLLPKHRLTNQTEFGNYTLQCNALPYYDIATKSK